MGDCKQCAEKGLTLWIKRPVQRFKALGVDVFQCQYGHTWTEPVNETIPAGNFYYDEPAYNTFVKELNEKAGMVKIVESEAPKVETKEEKGDDKKWDEDVKDTP